MYISDHDPKDFLAPPTVSEVIRGFSVPVMSFVSQPALEVRGFGTTGSSVDGAPTVLDTVSISYTFWRVPDNRADPANLADLTAAQLEAHAVVPIRPLPDWMMAQRKLMRYPVLWEAVRTSRLSDDVHQTLESVLVDHLNYVVMNTLREQRSAGGFPGKLDSPANRGDIEYIPVRVDGANISGMRLDTDPNVYAVGVTLSDRIMTAVVTRDYLADITVAFETLSGPET